jgi:hypothetical protein
LRIGYHNDGFHLVAVSPFGVECDPDASFPARPDRGPGIGGNRAPAGSIDIGDQQVGLPDIGEVECTGNRFSLDDLSEVVNLLIEFKCREYGLIRFPAGRIRVVYHTGRKLFAAGITAGQEHDDHKKGQEKPGFHLIFRQFQGGKGTNFPQDIKFAIFTP